MSKKLGNSSQTEVGKQLVKLFADILDGVGGQSSFCGFIVDGLRQKE